MTEDVTVSREHAERIAAAPNPFAEAMELGYGTALPEGVIAIEDWVVAGRPVPGPARGEGA